MPFQGFIITGKLLSLSIKPKLIRITTVPLALAYPLRGQPSYMQLHGFDVLMISADGKELQQLLQNETCRHIIVPMTRSITPFVDMVCIFKLIKIFKKEKPDIVHTETPKAGLLGMIAAKICNIKVRIHTVAGLPLMVEKGIKLRILKSVEKMTYAAATNIWPNSYSLERFILKNRFTDKKKVTVPGKGSSNGVNTERFNKKNLSPIILDKVKESVRFNDSNIYLLFIGRLVRDKGITELVNVFTTLQKERPGLKLILAGGYEPHLDPLPLHIEKEITGNKNIIHVEWTDKVEYYMAMADCFVFPSYREGFPNVLLEAAAMELPIVCSNIAGNIDIVTDNDTGLIFESQDETGLREKLTVALNEPERLKKMAAKLKETITTSYERSHFWETIRKAYEMLLNNKSL